MPLQKEYVQHIARLARLNLTPAEIVRFTRDLEVILDYMDQLRSVDTTGVKPVQQLIKAENVFRNDEVKPSAFSGTKSDRIMKPKVLGVIPARLGSRRFPGKVLYPYRGKPLLFYVWDSVRRSRQIDRLVIATDNSDVSDAAESFGAEVVMTSGRPRTGSDRVAEVARLVGGQCCSTNEIRHPGLPDTFRQRTVQSGCRQSGGQSSITGYLVLEVTPSVSAIREGWSEDLQVPVSWSYWRISVPTACS
jgi:aspartyl/glutamyl-tRNA(Asn/Gln) amidotransferase C subunit